MEAANGTLKVECVNSARFHTRAEAAREIIEFLGYYNTERLHSSLVQDRGVLKTGTDRPAVDNASLALSPAGVSPKPDPPR